MLETSLLNGFALEMLQLLAWATFGIAVVLLVGVALWMVLCCKVESDQHFTGIRIL